MSSSAPDRSTGQPIVLIHGMWMTPLSWEHWANRYQEQGHRVLAPAWPGLDGEPAEIRRDPSPLRGLSIPDVIDHYERIIREIDQPPIIIGHSFGGLFAQLLLNLGLGSAGAALGTGAPKGVLRLPYSTLRAAWPALHNPFGKNNIAPLTQEQFHWCFTNSLSRKDSDAVYERYYIPGSARPFFQAGYANFNPSAATKVDYRNPKRPPLLLVTGSRGPHLSALGQPGELQEAAPGTRCHRAQGVPRPLPLPGPGRLGGGRRLHPHLDDRARRPGSAEPGVSMRLTHIGGPTVLIQVAGWRLLTDPTFDPPGQKYKFGWGTGSVKLVGPAIAASDLGPIDAILLTHDHHDDNLDPAGRALVRVGETRPWFQPRPVHSGSAGVRAGSNRGRRRHSRRQNGRQSRSPPRRVAMALRSAVHSPETSSASPFAGTVRSTVSSGSPATQSSTTASVAWPIASRSTSRSSTSAACSFR